MDLEQLTRRLRELDDGGDEAAWPEQSVRAIADAGCFANTVPKRFGGRQATPREKVESYEAVAAGSLTLALILTQHDAACELLADCENESLPPKLLPTCAVGETLLTVGISQLTTSRQGGEPAMRAESVENGLALTGVMPWVTSSPRADYVVTGAVLPDNRQILACLPLNAPGVVVHDPMRFMALNASLTGRVQCNRVIVDREHLLRGPCEQALARRAPVKSLTVSSVGIGVSRALFDAIEARRDTLANADKLIDSTIAPAFHAIRARLHRAADVLVDPGEGFPAVELRVALNSLVVRLAATCLTLAKGTGYAAEHPVQRLCREAMFFLVWSAPATIQLGTLEQLWVGWNGALGDRNES
jgi:alkylation response protein AidB-like acyl-CoA dehydrogenase